MIKLVVGAALVVMSSLLSANLAGATTVNGNQGSYIKVSGSCSDALASASNNAGSIVEIDGGNCTVDELIGSGNIINNNAGSIVKIDNVCGDTSKIQALNNAGSIVKINAGTNCTPGKPTTVVVEKNTETYTPTELPKTGTGSVLLGTGITGVIGFGITSVLRRRD